MLPADHRQTAAGLEHVSGVYVLPTTDRDRLRVRQELSELETSIAEGAGRIARQEHLIAELERDGHDTVTAREILETFRQTLALHQETKKRLLLELGEGA